MKRVAVVGPVASGKTTFARALGEATGLPVTDLDEIYWVHGSAMPDHDWQLIHDQLIGRTKWVLAGDYRALAPDRFSAADTIVWLDLSRRVYVPRAIQRKIRGYRAPLLPCVGWIWRYPRHGRIETDGHVEELSEDTSVCRVRSRRQADQLLLTLTSNAPTWPPS